MEPRTGLMTSSKTINNGDPEPDVPLSPDHSKQARTAANIASLALWRGDLQKALFWYKKAIAHDPCNPEFIRLLELAQAPPATPSAD